MQVQIPCKNHDKLGEVVMNKGSIHAKNVVKDKLIEAYGSKIKVNFSETRFEKSEDGRSFFWAVETIIALRKRLFWKKAYRILCYVNAETGKIAAVRGKRA